MIIMKRLTYRNLCVSNNCGSTLLYLIGVILVMAVLGTALVNLTSTSSIGQISANHMDRAWFMAEAGANYAIPQIETAIQPDKIIDGSDPEYNQLQAQDFIIDDGGVEEGRFSILIQDETPGTDEIQLTVTGRIDAVVSTQVEVKAVYVLQKSGAAPPYSISGINEIYFSR